MKMSDFRAIAKNIERLECKYAMEQYDAVCLSRKIYNDLFAEAQRLSPWLTDDVSCAKVFGYRVFVRDDLPDEFYFFGYAHIFERDMFERKLIASITKDIKKIIK